MPQLFEKDVVMKRYLFSQSVIVLFVVFAFLGCNKISSDPKIGAKQLSERLTRLAESGNLKKTNAVLSDYWNSYNDEQRKEFLLTLRDELMDNDDVVEFIVESNFSEYPMCGLYMKRLHQVAYKEAISNIDHIAKSKSNATGYAAEKAVLLGILLADCYDSNDIATGKEIISIANHNLMKSSLFYRIEFAAAFATFMQESGELGIKACEFLTNKFDDEIKYAFYRILLESKDDSDLISDTSSLSETDEHKVVADTRKKNLPTKEEIQSVNANLPVKVAEGTMCTKVEYDEETMIQTFYYDFTQEVDASSTRPEIIENLKSKMVNALKGTDNEERIRDGVTFIFVYRSINKKVLYKIKIDASDFD